MTDTLETRVEGAPERQQLTKQMVEAWCDENGFTLVPRKCAQPFGGQYEDPQGAFDSAKADIRSGETHNG